MYKKGDIVYIIENNVRITEVQILNISGNLYTVKLLDRPGGFRIPSHRLYKTMDEAAAQLPHRDEPQPRHTYRPPSYH